MRQSIITKYQGPTDSRGSRISATSTSGQKVSIGYDSALNSDENHMAAAKKLAEKLDWKGEWIMGAIKDGYVWVQRDTETFTI